MDKSTETADLKRGVSFALLVFYGLGTIIGGGIYALTGKVAGTAGMHAPLAFAISALVALLTAFSYAELSSRFPLSAGEAKYVDAAFSRRRFSMLIGWLVVFTGLVSASTLTVATAGFMMDFVPLPKEIFIAVIVLLLGGLACWGIMESVALVTVITLIELGGLLVIVAAGAESLAALPERWRELAPPSPIAGLAAWGGIFSGAFLAFYAFIGFEDMVNVAEEVKDAKRSLPAAILVCIAASLLIYFLVIAVAVLSVPPADLAQSNTPLRMILERTGHPLPPAVMGLVSLLATVNGLLVQLIMCSRVLYGMARQNQAPAWLGHVQARTRTPVKSTLAVAAVILVLALGLDLATLARIASGIILFVFICINAALLKIKRMEKGKDKDKEAFRAHWSLPLAGLLTCAAMLVFEIGRMLNLIP